MTTRKVREFAIDQVQCDPIEPTLPSWYCAYATWTPDDQKEGRLRVREVLPEPTDAELDDLALKHATQFADDNLVAFHESGLDFKMGFRAALKWMKGESE